MQKGAGVLALHSPLLSYLAEARHSAHILQLWVLLHCSLPACLPVKVHQPPDAPCSQRQALCSSCCPLPTSMVTPLPFRFCH